MQNHFHQQCKSKIVMIFNSVMDLYFSMSNYYNHTNFDFVSSHNNKDIDNSIIPKDSAIAPVVYYKYDNTPDLEYGGIHPCDYNHVVIDIR